MKSSILFALCLFLYASTASAVITGTGLEPEDPNTWTEDTIASIGKSSDGSLTVNGDSDLLSKNATLGYSTGVEGTATVSGSGSTWTNAFAMYLGYSGTGTMDINSGGIYPPPTAISVTWPPQPARPPSPVTIPSGSVISSPSVIVGPAP